MEENKEYIYYVVEFLHPLINGLNKYNCVPDSWIQFKELANQVAVVKYPVENDKETQKRVKNKVKCRDNWSVFVTKTKFGTDSYKEAVHYIKELYRRSTKELLLARTAIADNKSSRSTRHIRSSRQSCSKTIDSSTSDDSDDSSSSSGQVNKPDSVNGGPVLTSRFAIDHNTSVPDEAEGTSDDSSVDDTISRRKKEDVTSVDRNVPDEEINESAKISREPIFSREFPDLLKKLHANFEKKALKFKVFHFAYLSYSAMMKKIIDLVEDFNNKYSDPIDTVSVEVATKDTSMRKSDDRSEMEILKKEKSSLKMVLKRKSQTEHEVERKRNKKTYEVDRETTEERDTTDHSRLRKFVLPKEYDKDDPRWTLRHREFKEGLIELVPHSNIYVDAMKLSNIKKTAKDTRMFARMLLVEIFADCALRTCSLTGKLANAFTTDENNIRPGLYEPARTVMLNYVQEYVHKNNWARVDEHTLTTTLRNKLQDMRSKF